MTFEQWWKEQNYPQHCQTVECKSVAEDAFNADKWINVEDNLPKIGKVVDIIAFGKRYTDLTFKYDESGYCFVNKSYGPFDISDTTHWQPLPQQPKGE